MCCLQYGLQSSYLACFVYVIFGSCRQATIGPTAVMGLLAFQTCGANNPSCAILTAFYTGIIELLMAFLRLGMNGHLQKHFVNNNLRIMQFLLAVPISV